MKIRALILALFVCLVFTGCFPSTSDVNDNKFNFNQSEDVPKHIKDKYLDNLLIDAEIAVSKDVNYNIYNSKLQTPDIELWKNYFFPLGTNWKETTNSFSTEKTDNPYSDVIYESEEGSGLAVGRSRALYIKDPNHISYFTLLENIKQNHPQHILSELLSNITIDTITLDKAKEMANDLIQKLALPVDKEPEIYPFNTDIIKKLDNTVTDDLNEGYFFIYYCSLDGVNIYHNNYSDATDGNPVYGSQLFITITEEGVVELRGYGYYDIIKCTQEDIDLISLDSAIQVIKDHYSSMLETNTVMISNISLEYVPLQNKSGENDFSLKPVWVVQAYSSLNGENFDFDTVDSIQIPYTVTHLIDASTGNFILTI